MISSVIDLTQDFNADGEAIIDIGGQDYIIIQLVNSTGNIDTMASNDGGAIEGVRDGSPNHATNFVLVVSENLATGAFDTKMASANGLYRIANPTGQYVKVTGEATVDKMLVFLSKIY